MDNVDIINITQEDFVGEIIQDEYKVLSIDIGVINMGLSLSVINKDYTFKEVLLVDNIDITSYKHSKCKYSECNLHHTKTFCDWVEHMIYENREHFDYCDIILLEKQPPKGFVVIEQLIYSKYRNKTYLINPRSVHKYLNFKGFDYDARKKFSEKIGDQYMSQELIEKTKKYKCKLKHALYDLKCMF